VTPIHVPIAADRPLLSRVAHSLYWMSRYVERAEHVARVLKINTNLLMDVGDLAPEILDRQWQSVMQITSMPFAPPGEASLGQRVTWSLAFDALNLNSLVACIGSARENARAIRSEISNEMWEQINQLYWTIRSDDTKERFAEQPDELLNMAIQGSMLFQGVTDQTLDHDQRWMFAQLAKSLERIDMTCRILDARHDALQDAESVMEAPLRNIQWMAVLRMCCSIETYRRQFSGELDPLRVIGFVILEDGFPRSIRFNVEQALAAISAIRQATSPTSVDPAERILGRLAATLAYANPNEIADEGVKDYLRMIVTETRTAAANVLQTYFLK
jgi:uncharacterized alpha-E superfamily protein